MVIYYNHYHLNSHYDEKFVIRLAFHSTISHGEISYLTVVPTLCPSSIAVNVTLHLQRQKSSESSLKIKANKVTQLIRSKNTAMT